MSTNVSVRWRRCPGLLALVLLLAASAAWADQVTPNDRVSSRLLVRSEAKSDAEIVGYLKTHDKVPLIKTTGAWREVKLPDTTGFVASSYSTVIPDGIPESPATAVTLPMPAGANLLGNRHVLLGIPLDADPSDDFLIDRNYWVASYNQGRLVPNWVAWSLSATDMGTTGRAGDFHPDDDLPASFRRVRTEDYTNSGYQRGHQCPSNDRTTTLDANNATFLMTNMQPQTGELNHGPWQRSEEWEQALARSGKHLLIIAGGVFTAQSTKISSGVAIPDASYKIAVVLEPGQTAADVTTQTIVCAFIMPNRRDVKKKCYDYLVSVDEVEKRTGYDFLRDVPDNVEKVIEAKVPTPQECGAP